MKECLVVTLMLSLTGMVVGQQSVSPSVFDSARTDSSRVMSPSSNPKSSSSAASRSDAVERIMKLDIDASMIEAIKQGQTLEATIDLKDVTNGIVMLFDDPSTLKPRVDEVPRNLKPDFISGDGVLHFTLDEVGLERLKSEGLQYEYRPGEKGTYQQVALKFAPSSGSRIAADSRTVAARNQNDLPLSRNRVSSVTDRTFGSNRRDQDQERAGSSSRLDPAPVPRTDRNRLTRDDFGSMSTGTDRDLAGKSAQTEADRYFEQQRLQQQRSEEIDRRRKLDMSQNYGLDHSQDNRNQNWNSSHSNHDSTNEPTKHTFELTDQEIDALASSTQQIRNERQRREAELERLRLEKLASDRQAQRANSDRIRLLQELRDRTSLDQTSVARRRVLDDDDFYTSYGRRNLMPSDRNLSRTASLDSQYDARNRNRHPDPIDSSSVASEAASLKLQEAALENERLRLELARSETDRTRLAAQHRLADLGDFSVNNLIRRSPLRMSDYGASIPGSQPQNGDRVPNASAPSTVTAVSGTHMTQTAVDHILSSFDGTNYEQVKNRVRGEVAAMSAAKTRVDKFNGFLLFLFFTFFAISLYLGWLAQSFYGQYGELADELRETFTATT